MTKAAIEARGLIKVYGQTKALDGLTLRVPQGKLIGLAGPNGAGKTTFIKCILGVTYPNEGFLQVLGDDPVSKPVRLRQRIAIVHQRSGMDNLLSAWDNILIYLRLRGADMESGLKRAIEFSDVLHVRHLLNKPVVTLSGGEARKFQIIRALLGRPDLLLLDEPTNNVDPPGRKALWHLTRELVERGTTVFWTTHDLHEMEALSDAVAIMKAGKCLVYGTARELADKVSGSAIRIEGNIPRRIREHLQSLECIERIKVDNGSAAIVARKAEELVPLIVSTVVDLGGSIRRVSVRPISLEEVLLRLLDASDGRENDAGSTGSRIS